MKTLMAGREKFPSARDALMLSDTLHPSRENFPGDKKSNGAPRKIPVTVGEQCSEFKSIAAEEKGAFTASAFARG